jgi:hypothetical protein
MPAQEMLKWSMRRCGRSNSRWESEVRGTNGEIRSRRAGEGSGEVRGGDGSGAAYPAVRCWVGLGCGRGDGSSAAIKEGISRRIAPLMVPTNWKKLMHGQAFDSGSDRRCWGVPMSDFHRTPTYSIYHNSILLLLQYTGLRIYFNLELMLAWWQTLFWCMICLVSPWGLAGDIYLLSSYGI